ncbi:MAG: tetratricopeptide repeat protein [Leptolyngbyaceae cyanobacterium bins.59]|nr:tetratricopeptide repeat protein [Leptolyngbyaceae cyanobacterium bins.59]
MLHIGMMFTAVSSATALAGSVFAKPWLHSEQPIHPALIDPLLLYRKASRLEEQGRLLDAEIFYTRALRALQRSADCFWQRMSYNGRARVRRELGNHRGAIEDYTQAIECADETQAIAMQYAMRAAFYNDCQDIQGAIDDYTQAIDLHPTFSAAYFQRGMAYLQLNQFAQALADFRKLEQLDQQRGNSEAASEARFYIEQVEELQHTARHRVG